MVTNKKRRVNKCWQGAGKREPSYTVGRNVNWFHHYGMQYFSKKKKVKIEIPYDTTIPHLSIFPKEMKIGYWKDICTPMFILCKIR